MKWGYVEKYKTTVMYWYLFIYVTVNVMHLAVGSSQQYYNITNSRSEKTAVKQLNTKHVPCTAV
jgi:hypothetical protein